MSTTATIDTVKPSPRKQKQHNKDPSRPQQQQQQQHSAVPSINVSAGVERLKTVVRRLPPNLPEDVFWQSVQAWVTDETVSWKSYYPGKFRTKRMNKEGIPSRAYIAFKNEEQVATFSREYDGHLFRDKAGNESQAVVEFAPFQKVPTEKKKVDARNNTIDKDEDYLSFLESLKKNAGKSDSVSLEALIAASQPAPPPTTTPLLEALKAEKSAQKDKEAIIRNHAHYKDAGASLSSSNKKEDAKKKAAALAAAKQQSNEPAAQPSSRKAKKAAAAANASTNANASAAVVVGTAAQKPTASTQVQQVQDRQKMQLAGVSPTPASVGGHGGRHRPSKELHGRTHAAKGDTSAVPAPSNAGAGAAPAGPGPASPAPVATDNVTPATGSPAAAQGHGSQRKKARPVIGLGRQFEAALSGTGVAVSTSLGSPGGPPGPAAPGPSVGERKKRDRGAGGAGAGAGDGGAGGKRKHQHQHQQREEATPVVVSSILQRPLEAAGSGGPADVAVMQRAHSPKVEGQEQGRQAHGGVEVGAGGHTHTGTGPVRWGSRRGRGRGRGDGHRGG